MRLPEWPWSWYVLWFWRIIPWITKIVSLELAAVSITNTHLIFFSYFIAQAKKIRKSYLSVMDVLAMSKSMAGYVFAAWNIPKSSWSVW